MKNSIRFQWTGRDLAGIVTLLMIIVLVQPSYAQNSTGNLSLLGNIWQVTECCGWSGTWTRRPNTNTFDAKFWNTQGETVNDVIELISWNTANNMVTLSRASMNGKYKVTYNPSNNTLVNGTASWYPAGQNWSANIGNPNIPAISPPNGKGKGSGTANALPSGMNIATVPIPGGTFTMGSPLSETTRAADEGQHQVTVSAFRMSKYEITNAQFAQFLNAKGIGSDGVYAGGALPGSVLISPSSGDSDFSLHYTGNKWVPVAGYENHPVFLVSWHGAVEFATYVGGRLPTEAEWEYACRGTTTTNFNTGDCLSNTEANYDWVYPIYPCKNTNASSPGKTKPVGSYPANKYGLHDMHGNVLEWCSDWYAPYPAAAQTNPAGPKSGVTHVMRGGSWAYMALYARSARRSEAGSGSIYCGIRLVFAL